jgi:hypothetical protein
VRIIEYEDKVRGDNLSLGVFSIGNSIMNDVLKDDLQDTRARARPPAPKQAPETIMLSLPLPLSFVPLSYPLYLFDVNGV